MLYSYYPAPPNSIWEVGFFPLPEERKSAFDFIEELPVKIQSTVKNKIRTQRKLEKQDWPPKWEIKSINNNLYQFTPTKKYRLYFTLDGNTIVFLHACKKVKGKADKLDIARAKSHRDMYYSEK